VTQEDLQPVRVNKAEVSSDGKTVSLQLEQLKPGYIYELKLGAITDSKGDSLANQLVCYTLNQLK
ncbi:MAG TPA: hypothetical protein VD772_06450, partial [Anseongella sp.]|nr:hypothetical protein [Anseongella sp.]